MESSKGYSRWAFFRTHKTTPRASVVPNPMVCVKKIELQTRYLEAVAMGHYGPILTALSHQCVRSPTWWAAVAGVYCLRCVAWKCGKALQDFTTWHDLTWIFYDILISLLGPFCKDSSCGGKLCSGSLLETKRWGAIVILWCSAWCSWLLYDFMSWNLFPMSRSKAPFHSLAVCLFVPSHFISFFRRDMKLGPWVHVAWHPVTSRDIKWQVWKNLQWPCGLRLRRMGSSCHDYGGFTSQSFTKLHKASLRLFPGEWMGECLSPTDQRRRLQVQEVQVCTSVQVLSRKTS